MEMHKIAVSYKCSDEVGLAEDYYDHRLAWGGALQSAECDQHGVIHGRGSEEVRVRHLLVTEKVSKRVPPVL